VTPNPRYWPISDLAAIEITATLLNFKGRFEQPVWTSHFGKLADVNGVFCGSSTRQMWEPKALVVTGF